jgi:tetratricopeptide (TPR) repeat protein
MASDDDIARLLPEPPPPRPTRREAGIAAALRRFDGTEEPLPAAPPRPSRWSGLGRPQLGALISAALIALIGAPAAWMSLHDRFPAPDTAASTNASEAGVTADSAPAVPITSPSRPAPAAGSQSSAAALRAGPSPAAAPPPAFADKAVASPEADAKAGTPPSATAMKQAQPDAAVPPPPPPPAPAAMGFRAAPTVEAQPDAADIAVTASRIRAPAQPGRADGFARSSENDIDGVIAMFDQALARDPHNSGAWLNRGLARQRKGDLNGALDDLTQAIHLAPDAPAGYRARARLERQRGDTGRALADEHRAAELEADR